jgi:hypothetical protein
MAEHRERDALLDSMAVADLREAAIVSLNSTATTIASTSLTKQMMRNGWTASNAEELASYFSGLVRDIDRVGPNGTTNMSKWFDSAGVTLKGEDELKSAAYGAAEVFNAYVRRRWPR